jgi:hypothetical protein
MAYHVRRMKAGEPFTCIARDSDGALIPLDLGNRDCRQFLADWIAGLPVIRPNGQPYPYTAAHRTELGLDE